MLKTPGALLSAGPWSWHSFLFSDVEFCPNSGNGTHIFIAILLDQQRLLNMGFLNVMDSESNF